MATLITLLFQGEVEAGSGPGQSSGATPLSTDEAREVVHAAFPMSPPRDATSRADFRAWKMVPLTSGRLLLSTIVNRGEEDEYGRPVLRANGCLLAAGEMTGALRDPTAVWEALETSERTTDFESFASRVEALSIHSSPEAFALFRAELERAGTFHARAAAVLGEDTADLYLGDVGRALDLLRPALGLLPSGRLERLHLAIGADASDDREPILGLAGGAPDTLSPARLRGAGLGSLLSGLFDHKKKDGRSAAAADFETRETFGTHDQGPVALAEAIADPRPWPLGLDGHDRYRVLLECADTGGATTLFDAVPELEDLRRRVQRIEKLSKDLGRW